MKKNLIIFSVILAVILPALAFGQSRDYFPNSGVWQYHGETEQPEGVRSGSLNTINNVNDLVVRIAGLANVAIYLLIALAVLYIVWNIVQYMIKGDDVSVKKEAGKNVLWGIVGLFIIVSLWGLVNILVNTFSTDTDFQNRLPNADFVTGND